MHSRREMFGTLAGLAAVCVSAQAVEAQKADPMAGMGNRVMTKQECADTCHKLHVMCLETVKYCLEQGGKHILPSHIALLLDCAEICQTTANSLTRDSPQHIVVCDACARICEVCARDCETFQADSQMERCGRTCKICAVSCHDMVKTLQ